MSRRRKLNYAAIELYTLRTTSSDGIISATVLLDNVTLASAFGSSRRAAVRLVFGSAREAGHPVPLDIERDLTMRWTQ